MAIKSVPSYRRVVVGEGISVAATVGDLFDSAKFRRGVSAKQFFLSPHRSGVPLLHQSVAHWWCRVGVIIAVAVGGISVDGNNRWRVGVVVAESASPLQNRRHRCKSASPLL